VLSHVRDDTSAPIEKIFKIFTSTLFHVLSRDLLGIIRSARYLVCIDVAEKPDRDDNIQERAILEGRRRVAGLFLSESSKSAHKSLLNMLRQAWCQHSHLFLGGCYCHSLFCYRHIPEFPNATATTLLTTHPTNHQTVARINQLNKTHSGRNYFLAIAF
jgi:hypothetical protein